MGGAGCPPGDLVFASDPGSIRDVDRDPVHVVVVVGLGHVLTHIGLEAQGVRPRYGRCPGEAHIVRTLRAARDEKMERAAQEAATSAAKTAWVCRARTNGESI